MKIKTLVAILLLSLLNGCHKNSFVVTGSKHLVSREYNVNDYDKIVITVPAEVEYSQSPETPSLLIETDDNIMEHLYIRTEGRVLYIKPQRRANGNHPSYCELHPSRLKIWTNSTSLREIDNSGKSFFKAITPIRGHQLEIEQSGSGEIMFYDSVSADQIEIEISGSGKVLASQFISGNRLELTISGSGNITLANGAISSGETRISGSGSLHALSCEFSRFSCNISGSGSVSASVLASLSYRISGSGKLSYKGNPHITDSSISGSGKVIRLD